MKTLLFLTFLSFSFFLSAQDKYYNAQGKEISYDELVNILFNAVNMDEGHKGESITYYESGIIKSKILYNQDTLKIKYIAKNGTGKIIDQYTPIYYSEEDFYELSYAYKMTTYNTIGNIQAEVFLSEDFIANDITIYYETGEIKSKYLASGGLQKYREHKEYYKSGKLFSIYIHDTSNLPADKIEYYETGEILAIMDYNNYDNIPNDRKEFYKSGTIKSYATYKDGLLHGDFTAYDESENIIEQSIYKEGIKQ